MSGLSAAEAKVLFAGELLSCFIEARDARGCVCFGGRWGRGRGRGNGGAGKRSLGSVGAGGFGFARVGVVELNEILLNPARASDELGQCGGGPEVEELGRERGKELVAEFSDGGTGVLITPKLDIAFVPLGQERVNCVVGFHYETIHGSQSSSVFVRVLETIVEQVDGSRNVVCLGFSFINGVIQDVGRDTSQPPGHVQDAGLRRREQAGAHLELAKDCTLPVLAPLAI